MISTLRTCARSSHLAVAMAAAVLLAASPAQAMFSYCGLNDISEPGCGGTTSSDVVMVFVKNGHELILNLGPLGSTELGDAFSFDFNPEDAKFQAPAAFDGSLEGAKWMAFAVRDPAKFNLDIGVDNVPQGNLILTTPNDPSVIDFVGVANAQVSLDPPAGTSWLDFLRVFYGQGLGQNVNGTTILENEIDRLVIRSDAFNSYESTLGRGSDQIENTVSLSTRDFFDGVGDSLILYELWQTIDLAANDLSREIRIIGSITAVPEAGTALLLAAGLGGLVGFGRRRDR